MANLTTLDQILKTQYIGPLNEQINNDIKLLKRIETIKDEIVTGKNFTLPLHISRNEGIGARAEGANLPAAGAQGYKDSVFPMRYLYGVITVSGPSIAATKNNEGAFVRAVDSEMKGVTKDLKADLNRMLYGDGTGVLAAATTNSTASTTVTVDSTAKLRVGMHIDIIAGTTASVSDATITAINSATSFTHNGTSAAVAANSKVYRTGTKDIEVMGLAGIVSATDPISTGLQGLTVAANPYWKASVLGNSGTNRALTLALMRTALDTVETAGNGKTTAIYTTHGVRRAYEALLQADRKYVNVMKLDGGVETLAYDNLPIIADKDCQANRLYFVDESELVLAELGEGGFQWMDEDGAILSRNGKDGYDAVLYRYCELATRARNAHALLADITEA
jgi:hypothetical protein